ncbi:MAG: DEAD/DEAH box helicase, partial [Nitrososphaera sp.]
MLRHGKYYDDARRILQFLVTSTDRGICARPVILEKLDISDSSASDVLHYMKDQGLIRIGKRSFNNVQSIEITPKGRSEYDSMNIRGSVMPRAVKRYLLNKKRKPDRLFTIQKDFVERGLIESSKNVCIFAYPGSGKTLAAEMAMVAELEKGGRALYCTPYKALDWQKYTDFENSFKILGAKILIADGDSPVSSEDLESANIVIGTYERIMGAIRSKEKWLQNISLVCADEITLFADDDRGAAIDTVLTYLRGSDRKRRIITMSSLVENTIEIAKWLDAELIIDNRPAFAGPINESVMYREDGKIIKWDRSGKRETVDGDDALTEIIKNNLRSGKTTVVFEGTRDGTEYIAESLAKLHQYDKKLEDEAMQFLSALKEKSSRVERLCRMIPYGIAYHHAGLQKKVRRFVEDLVRQGKLKIVVATTTLSHGVDYNIDSVVVILSPAGILRDLHVYDYINLKGRTGRPGKSKHADIYLLTGPRNAQSVFTKYFSSAPEPIRPLGTVGEENLSTLLLSYSYPKVDLTEIADFLNSSFCCFGKRVTMQELEAVAQRLSE